ncbi:hypothetical protein CsSME_00011398 [Camellia sinensis var. sinensis]
MQWPSRTEKAIAAARFIAASALFEVRAEKASAAANAPVATALAEAQEGVVAPNTPVATILAEAQKGSCGGKQIVHSTCKRTRGTFNLDPFPKVQQEEFWGFRGDAAHFGTAIHFFFSYLLHPYPAAHSPTSRQLLLLILKPLPPFLDH